MTLTNQRTLTTDESSHVGDVLSRLRNHFSEWPNYENNEHELVSFAFYEGCGGSDHCGNLLAEAAPFALASALVSKHGFEWVMVFRNQSWKFALRHASLESPIELSSLEDGRWNDNEYDETPCPGETTNDSLECIVRRVSHQNPENKQSP